MKEKELLLRLKFLRGLIPKNTYKTIKGQILSGDHQGAITGLQRIERRLMNG